MNRTLERLIFLVVASAFLGLAIISAHKGVIVLTFVLSAAFVLLLYVILLDELQTLIKIFNDYIAMRNDSSKPGPKQFPKDRFGKPKLKVIKFKKDEV